MHQDIQAAIVQGDTRFADAAGNLAHLEELISANGQICDLYLLPELFNTGYRNAFTSRPETMNGASHRWMMVMAERTGAVMAGTISIAEDGKTFNRFLFVRPDGITQHYDKVNVFAYSGEDKVYSAGTSAARFEWKGWNIKPIICFDLRFPETARNHSPHYDLLLCPAHWPASRMPAWDRLLPARAVENQCYVLASNRIGKEGEISYAGHSAAIDFLGENLSVKIPAEEGVFHFRLEKKSSSTSGRASPF